MKQAPLISIVIPVYKCEEYIKQCIDSIIAQTIGFDNLEIVLINDCSPCNAPKIIEEEYVSKYSNIRLIHNKINMGPGGSRNVGIKEVKSDLVAFIDSDDWYKENFCEAILENYNTNKADITVCGMINTVDGVNVRWDNIPPKGIYTEEAKLDLIFQRKVECHCIFRLFNKSLFIDNDIWFEEEKYYEDLALMPKLFYHANKISCMDDVLYNYRFNANSIVNTSSIKHISDINSAWAENMRNVPINKDVLLFFWFSFAHNVFRKRKGYLNSASKEDLLLFFKGFFELLEKYPILVFGMERNDDIIDTTNEIIALDKKHNELFSKTFSFSILDNYKPKEEVKGLVSVIMPAYNTQDYILDAIDSILCQDYEKIEVIVVNDCSTDNTKANLEKLNDSRVTIVNVPNNSGAYYCRNIGLFLAKGEFVTTVDSDDIIPSERIRVLFDFMKNNENVKLVESRFARYDDKGKVDFRLFTQDVGHGFYRKSALNDLGFFLPVKGGADSELSDRIREVYGKESAVITDDFIYWCGMRDECLTTVNPQGSPSRREFKEYHNKTKIIKVEFPWRISDPITRDVLSLEIGQKNHNKRIQDIAIRKGNVKGEIGVNEERNKLFYSLSNQGMGFYYKGFLDEKDYVKRLEHKVRILTSKESEVSSEAQSQIKTLESELKKASEVKTTVIFDNQKSETIQQHYDIVFEKMPMWWKKMGALVRKIKN